MDVTPLISANSQVIQAYSADAIKVSGKKYDSTILVFQDRVEVLDLDSFQALTAQNVPKFEGIDIFIIGTGTEQEFLSKELKTLLSSEGIVSETMTTAAACRTYNVLMAEGRRIACLLFLPKA